MNKEALTLDEKRYLDNWAEMLQKDEMAQAQDLIDNCDISFQFAKTHSVYVKDWEKTKKQMEDRLVSGDLPPGASANLLRAMIDVSDKIYQKKFEIVRQAFAAKFGESIYNYLGPDGKTRKFLGLF